MRIVSDEKRAIRTVRYRAKKWNPDPNKIGIRGGGVGCHLASAVSTVFDSGHSVGTGLVFASGKERYIIPPVFRPISDERIPGKQQNSPLNFNRRLIPIGSACHDTGRLP